MSETPPKPSRSPAQPLPLPAVLDMRAAPWLYDHMMAALQSGGDIRLDASQVERLSTPCMQILLSAATTLDQVLTGHRIRVTDASEAFWEAFNDLGYGSLIERWSE